MNKLAKRFEVYKCVVLTLIAFLLAAIWLLPPTLPVEVRQNRYRTLTVEVQNGLIPVNVEVDNHTLDVEVQNTVEVKGAVSIER